MQSHSAQQQVLLHQLRNRLQDYEWVLWFYACNSYMQFLTSFESLFWPCLYCLIFYYYYYFFSDQRGYFQIKAMCSCSARRCRVVCCQVISTFTRFFLVCHEQVFFIYFLSYSLYYFFHSRPISLLAWSSISSSIYFKLFSFNYYLFIYLLYSLFSTEETTRTQRQWAKHTQ